MRRRFRRRPSLASMLLIALTLLVLSRIGWDWRQRVRAAGRSRVDSSVRHGDRTIVFTAGPCAVERVIDGNTLWVRQLPSTSSGKEQVIVKGPVRLLGIQAAADSSAANAPLATAARQFAADFVASGNVMLELDKRRIDADGCFLAYVAVDGHWLNVELLRAGLARLDSQPGDSATIGRELRRAADEARSAKRGIWKTAPAPNAGE